MDVLNLLLESRLVLISWKISIVESKVSAGDKSYLNVILSCEVIKKLLKSEAALVNNCFVEDCVSFWNGLDSAEGDWIVVN